MAVSVAITGFQISAKPPKPTPETLAITGFLFLEIPKKVPFVLLSFHFALGVHHLKIGCSWPK